MQLIQHGIGRTIAASTTAAVLEFTEYEVAKGARVVMVSNTGATDVLLLVNVDPDNVAAQFTNLTPIILETASTFPFPIAGSETGGWYKNIAVRTAGGTSTVVVNAY